MIGQCIVKRIETKVNKYFELEVFHRLNEHITENRKLSLYASFKTIFKFESYLDYIKDFTARRTLAQLRMSAHNLQIETGRFSKNKTFLPVLQNAEYSCS